MYSHPEGEHWIFSINLNQGDDKNSHSSFIYDFPSER